RIRVVRGASTCGRQDQRRRAQVEASSAAWWRRPLGRRTFLVDGLLGTPPKPSQVATGPAHLGFRLFDEPNRTCLQRNVAVQFAENDCEDSLPIQAPRGSLGNLVEQAKPAEQVRCVGDVGLLEPAADG